MTDFTSDGFTSDGFTSVGCPGDGIGRVGRSGRPARFGPWMPGFRAGAQ